MNSSTLILSKRFLIISAAVAIAIAVKLCTPASTMDGIPAIWSAITSWLKPPYLYIVINFIIITIAASSRLHASPSEPSIEGTHPPPTMPPPSVFAPVPEMMVERSSDAGAEESSAAEIAGDVDEEEVMDKTVVVEAVTMTTTTTMRDEGEPTGAPPSPEVNGRGMSEFSTPLLVREKPLVSTRFGHRRPTRTSLHEAAGSGGVRALGVARPKKQETLESTWKMVTEGRHVPLTRHLKTKSERWEHASPEMGHVPKSETFKERTSAVAASNYTGSAAVNRVNGKIRKEPSLGQDELNRRVEAFIKKFNEEMRIERQESLNRFMEMINRGV